MAEYESHSYDVIVIGAGGARLRAAIEAKARVSNYNPHSRLFGGPRRTFTLP